MSEEDIILYNKTNCCHLCLKEIPHKNYRVWMADIWLSAISALIWRKLYLNSRNRFFAFYLFGSFQKTWIWNLKRRVMSTDIALRSKLKVKEDLTSKYLLKRQNTMDNFIAIYLSIRSWIRSQSSDKCLISKYQWFWEIIKNE